MFAMTRAQRWRPDWSLLAALLALSIFLGVATSAVAALRGPRLLGYRVAPAAQAHWWRVTAVWPSSFAWDARLRPGTLLQGDVPPATRGATVVRVWAGRCCRVAVLPPRGESMPGLAWLELPLAAIILALGAGPLLFARARIPALLLLLFCLVAAVGLCGAAAFAHGAIWGSVLFEVCWFALLPPLTLLLATTLPPGGRALGLGWRLSVLLGGCLIVLEAIGFVNTDLYTFTRAVGGTLFALCQALAIGIWIWRAWPARGGPQWPEYRLVLLGLGGFALLAVLPAMLRWRLPWPAEADALVLLLFPGSLSWALLRYRLLELRRTVQRTAVTALLLAGVLCLGLALAAARMGVLGVCLTALLAGVGVPLAQHIVDRLLPDSRSTYAALVQRSGERLSLAIEMSELGPILDEMRRGLGLAGLSLRRGEMILAQAGVIDPAYARRFQVRHETDVLAVLEVGEKLRHDTLLAADLQALTMFCQHLGAFLTGQRLLLQVREMVEALEEAQQRLLTARRRERG